MKSGPQPSRPVRFERELDTPIGRSRRDAPEFGPHVAQGVRVRDAAELLADLVAVRLGEGAEPSGGREPPGQLAGDRIAAVAPGRILREELEDWSGAAVRSTPQCWRMKPRIHEIAIGRRVNGGWGECEQACCPDPGP